MDNLTSYESVTREYKRKFSDKDLKEIVAFLNTKGGILYIGIEDNGKICGIENIDTDSLKIKDKIKDGILPSVMGLFEVQILTEETKAYIKITVAKGNETPYYIKAYGISEKGCYVRNGSSSDPMPTSMIDELYAKRVRNSLSRIISPRQDLTFSQLKIYYQEKGLTINDKFLNNLELLTEDGRYNYNAYLLADDNGVSMKVAVYNGVDKYDLIENSENGYHSLINSTYKVLDKLDKYNTTHAKITGKANRDEWQNIDKVALREAVINAIIHNDYVLNEVPPVFEIYDDRLEITSRGGLPIGMTEEDFYAGISNPRNKVLMRVFKDMDLVEHLGSGMGRILKKYDKSIFEIKENYIKITFKFENYKDNDSNGTQMERKWNANGTLIIDYLKENKKITAKIARELLGLGKSQTYRILDELQKDDVIVKMGKSRGTYYRLK